MAKLVTTYGEMPTREQYDMLFDDCVGDGLFPFLNDPRVGSCLLSASELWKELEKAHKEYTGLLESDSKKDPEVVGNWLSTVLSVLGVEWV